MASKANKYRTRRRLLMLLALGAVVLALSKPSPADFDAYVDDHFPVTSLVQRTSRMTVTGGHDYWLFTVHGVQTVRARRHYVGAFGCFWEI